MYAKQMHRFGFCQNCNYILSEKITNCTRCFKPITYCDISIFIGRKFSKYRIVDVLGEGGMGVVFKAQHEVLSHFAAIKMLLPQVIDDSMLKRFNKEAQLLANIKHPNIVEVYDADINEYGFPYYIMEYLEGISLRQFMINASGPLSPDKASSIMLQIIEGLAYAHQQGIIHRDLKPENIFLSKIGDKDIVKILDFGIAKILSIDSMANIPTSSLTLTGTILGTPYYMSPEQLLAKEVDYRTDVYSAGLIFYETLTGNLPACGRPLSEIILYHISEMPAEEIDKDANLQKPVRDFLKHCICKDLNARFANAYEMKNYFCDIELISTTKKSELPKKSILSSLSSSDKI